jgi:hypothetical protein
MMEYNKEYFNNNCYFFLKDKGDVIDLYYSVSNTIIESRENDEKKQFKKKDEKKLKHYLSKVMKSSKKVTKDKLKKDFQEIEKDGELEELVDFDGTMLGSKIPKYNMYLHPKKTMDQTISMSRITNDPVTRGYRVYWGESEEKDENVVSEVDYSDAFGYEETEDKDFKGTVKTLKKMGVENPVERAKEFGKLPKAKKKNGKLRQRLSEKDQIEEIQRKRMEKLIEDILTDKYQDTSEVMEKDNGINKLLSRNLKSIKKLAEKEGISIPQLIKMLKTDE